MNVGDTLLPLKKTMGQRLRRTLVSAVKNVERALVNAPTGSFWSPLSRAEVEGVREGEEPSPRLGLDGLMFQWKKHNGKEKDVRPKSNHTV